MIGLTLNGAIHDLRYGSPGRWFPQVLAASLLIALAVALLGRRLRDRWFPPIHRVAFDSPGLEGREARITSRWVNTRPRSGRARLRAEDGVLHLLRCHTESGSLTFGQRVLLIAFDASSESYLVEPI